jgi:hypothetical protein
VAFQQRQRKTGSLWIIDRLLTIGSDRRQLADAANSQMPAFAQEDSSARVDDVLNEYREPGSDPLWQLTVRVLRELSAAQTAAGARVSERTVERALAGQPVGKTARAKLTDHAVKHARAQLRAAGIPRPPDREALLAAVLDRQIAPDPEPQLCACGCGQPIPTERRRGQPRKYIGETHRKRAQRRQR